MIYVNEVYQSKINDEIFRVIEVDNSNDICYLYKINSNKLKCEECKLGEFERDIETEYYLKIMDSYIVLYNEEKISQKDKEKRDKYWHIVESSWYKYKEKILSSIYKENIFKIISNEFNINESTLRRLYARYFNHGMTKNSLLSKYNNCGRRGKERKLGCKKVGRPKKYSLSEEQGINITDDIKVIFQKAIKDYYAKYEQISLKEVYKIVLRHHFSYEYIENNMTKYTLFDDKDIPSYGQLYYWFNKNKDEKNNIISRQGEKQFDLKYRMLLSNSTIETIGPGTRFQIDATIADVYLVSKLDKEKIIGRPIVYAVIDVYSRMIVGISVGLEGPSWIGAMMTLDNMVCDKIEYCKSYGINITEEQWPSHHLPQIIIADRGEFEGYNVENLISNLGITIENTSPYRGDLKGIVERNFRTLNTKIKHKTPGAIMKEYRQRGDEDHRLKAVLTLEAFTKIYIEIVVNHNNSVISKYPSTIDMTLANIKPIPVDIWKWGIENKKGNLKVIDRDIMKLNVMPTSKASVRRQGIRFKGLYYSCEKAIEEQWFINSKIKSISISYDPRNLDYIYIISENGFNYEKCFLLEKSFQYKNLSLEEIIYYQELMQEKAEENKTTDIQLSNNTDANIESIIKDAIKEKRNNNTLEKVSKTQKTKDIKYNRSVEKAINRNLDSFEIGKVKQPFQSSNNCIRLDELVSEDTENQNELYNKIRQKGKDKLGKQK